jgi:hypothetical protein
LGAEESKPVEKGVKGLILSTPELERLSEAEGEEGRGGIGPLSGTGPFTYRETRASSSCVSCIYSAGGRGIKGGGAEEEVDEFTPFTPLTPLLVYPLT